MFWILHVDINVGRGGVSISGSATTRPTQLQLDDVTANEADVDARGLNKDTACGEFNVGGYRRHGGWRK